ncbi:MAG: multidrug ABC transporter ATP-binding protein [Firmicutes bacterium HGW-Firmicutes-16]|nr:MAG: multidrug ABC transporter ATP-binding protein [Firmicutes bacterium HGW-Firmicutes-16]
MIKILKYMKKKERLLVLCSLVFIVAQVFLDLKLPDYMTEITKLVQTGDNKISDILTQGGWMLLCAFGSLVASIIVAGFAARIASSFSMGLRELQFDKVEAFSMQEINSFSTASLITRSTNDITQVQMFIAMGLQLLIKAPITAVWAVTKIAGKGWQWTTATAVAVLVLIIVISIVITFAIPKFRKIQGLTDNLNRVTRENLTGIRVVRAYNAEKYQENKFEGANSELTNNNLFANRIMSIMMPSMSLIMSGMSLAIYWIGAYLIDSAGMMDKITLFSNMVVFMNYAVQVVMSFMMVSMIFIMLPRASVAAKRIVEVIETKPTILDGKKTTSVDGLEGEIEFRNVSFKYPDAAEYVLEDVSFTAHRGETVAFIGSTGSGKSTLINLVPRFYDTTEGEVLIDGVNVRDYTQEALHNKFGYVPQRAVIFSGTVESNVAYGDNGKGAYTTEDVENSIAIAQSSDFVENIPGKLEGKVAQGGTNLSGGQKQRLSIARAVCRKPEIYIFDDSFSALDYKTDKLLRHALKEKTSDTTSLIVAQRIGTIKEADKIVVLEEGRVVGIGTHEELMKSCSVYQEIALSQLSKEELA